MERLKSSEEFVNEFNNVLIDGYAKDKNQWTKHIDFFSNPFLISFLDNIEYLYKIKNSKNEIMNKLEKNKMKIILQFYNLFETIKIDPVKREITIDINKIDKNFTQLNDKNKSKEIQETIYELDKNNQSKSSFETLYNNFNLVIRYVKDEDFRKDFYKKYLLSYDGINLLKTKINYQNNQLL